MGESRGAKNTRQKGGFAQISPSICYKMFTGTYTAIVTPFKNGVLDEAALERLIKLQIKGGVDGIVPVGTTGESPTVDYDEHIRIIELAVKFAKGKVKVMAGTGANSTKEAIYLTKRAEEVGADGSLQVAPYYNKPTQEGLFQHFSAIAKATFPAVVASRSASRRLSASRMRIRTSWASRKRAARRSA